MPASPSPSQAGPSKWLVTFGHFWWEFLVGDTPELFVGMLVVLGLAAVLAGTGTAGWVIVPLAVVALLAVSVARAGRTATGAGE